MFRTDRHDDWRSTRPRASLLAKGKSDVVDDAETCIAVAARTRGEHAVVISGLLLELWVSLVRR